jgi:septum formation protein
LKPIAKIILASASPRRKQLLAEAGYEFEVVPSSVDESVFPIEGVEPVGYAKQLASAKANDVAEKYPDSLVIGADTVVDFEGRIIGKPTDAKDAERIVRMLFSRPHKVITAVAIVCKKGGTGLKSMHARAGSPCHIEIIEADTTVVFPQQLIDIQIAEHIASGIWQGKAGAYAIRECDPFVEHIEGSLTNVMGLPMELLGRLLDSLATRG